MLKGDILGKGKVWCFISIGRKGEDPRGDKEEDLSLRERRCNRKEENFIFLRAQRFKLLNSPLIGA